jgi:hypothetical protein
MAKGEYIYLQGKTKWFRHDHPDQYGKWKHVLYFNPDTDTFKKITDLKEKKGILNVLKKDEDGYNMTFTRPTQKTYQGKVQGFAPPEIIDANGIPLRNVNVGNGSDVTTKIYVYPYKSPGTTEQKWATRWESSRIDNLVPFDGKRDFDEDTEKLVRNLEGQPPQPGF